jgi:hypothetical protein
MALQVLVPKALLVLGKHLGEGDEVNADAWRAAVRILSTPSGARSRRLRKSMILLFSTRSGSLR